MADYYTTDSYRTVQVLAPNTALEVEEVGFNVLPANIYARVAIPRDDWLAGDYDKYLGPMADGIASVAEDDRVAALYFEQDVSPSGLLIDNMVIVVQVRGTQAGQFGPFQGEVRAPTYAFAGQGRDYLVNIPIAEEAARLTALARL